MHQVPIIPPLDLVITNVKEHGRPRDLNLQFNFIEYSHEKSFINAWHSV